MGSPLDVLHSATADDTADSARWRTPPEVFSPLRARYRIGLDACAMADSALVPWWIGPDHPNPRRRDALTADWSRLRGPGGGGAWMNPPYSDVGRFIAAANRNASPAMPVVCLVFARVETLWWHEIVWPRASDVVFVRGRIHFLRGTGEDAGPAPAPSVVIVFAGADPDPRGPRCSTWRPGDPLPLPG